jgi:hypothetical protein
VLKNKMSKNKYHKPKVFSVLIASLAVAAFAVLNFMYIFPLSKFFSIIFSMFLIPLFIYLFIPVLRYQRVCIKGDKIFIKCFWNTYILSISESFYELYKSESYRFHDKGRYFQVSPTAYQQSNELRKKLNEKIK